MKKRVSAILVAALWLVLTAMAWFLPARETSVAERRPLAQMPQADVKDVLNGSFMDEFEDYALDQFPLRDSFRQIKSLFHYYVLGQKDNNGIYLYQGYAAKQEYPLKEASVCIWRWCRTKATTWRNRQDSFPWIMNGCFP